MDREVRLLYREEGEYLLLIGGASMEPSKKPLNVLTKQLNTYISIMLKNGVEYRGTMVRCDGYMNIMINGASEYVREQLTANYGRIFVRGNNILYIAINIPRRK